MTSEELADKLERIRHVFKDEPDIYISHSLCRKIETALRSGRSHLVDIPKLEDYEED